MRKIADTLAIPLLAIPWILAVMILGWFVVQRFPPSGVFVTTTSLDGSNAFLHPFLPSERVTPPGVQDDGWVGQRIIGDPVYGSARVPGPYEHVDVAIEFRPIRQPLLEFGVARDVTGQDLDLQPIFFEELAEDAWTKSANGYVSNGINPVHLTDPNASGIAVWDATTTMPLYVDDTPVLSDIAVSLRGAHDFYLVPAGGQIDVTLTLQDANRKEGRTVAAVRVFRGEEEIEWKVLETNASQETSMGVAFEHRVHIEDAQPGVYRIRFQADDDLFIRRIRTTSRRWVVGPRVNFGDVVGYATTTSAGVAWTNSRHLVAETLHREGLQVVRLGTTEVELSRTHETFRLDRYDIGSGAVRLSAPVGDVRLVGDGWFALIESAFFVPMPSRLTDGTRLRAEGIVGVVTPYERPEALGDGWYRAQLSFPLKGDEDNLRLVLSAPGIVSRSGAVDIRSITATYRRSKLDFFAWKDVIFQEIRNAWRRL